MREKAFDNIVGKGENAVIEGLKDNSSSTSCDLDL